MSPVLQVENLDCRYGLLQAVRGVSFAVEPGETLALIGANGAGKTTLLRAIAGAHKPFAGHVQFDGVDVTKLPAHRRVSLGIALVPEGRRLFAGLTVDQNLRAARVANRPGRWTVDAVLEVFPFLRQRRHMLAANLSGGEQQAVAIGRALMSNPRLLLLDEVSLGLAPQAVESVYRSLSRIIAEGTNVVLVEQDLTRALEFADNVLCMLEGRIALRGSARSLDRDRVVAAYFGLRQAAPGGAR